MARHAAPHDPALAQLDHPPMGDTIVTALQDEIQALRAKAAEVVDRHHRDADEAEQRITDEVAAARAKIEDEMAAVLREITDQLHAGVLDDAAPSDTASAPDSPTPPAAPAPDPTPAPVVEPAPSPSWPTA